MNKVLSKILYVEDDPSVREVTIVALENIGGFDVEICINGKEALEKVQDFNPDLILTDMMMPEMDGLTLLNKLKSKPEYKNIPVVFMTARVQSHELVEYISSGAIGIIKKPYDPLTLSDELKTLWADFKSLPE